MTYNTTTSEIYNNTGNLTIGGNVTILGSIVNVGSTQIRAQSVSNYGTTSASSITLTAQDIIGGIVYTDCTVATFNYTFPTAASLSAAGVASGSIFQISLLCSAKFTITANASGGSYPTGILGPYSVQTGVSMRQCILNMTSSSSYTLYA